MIEHLLVCCQETGYNMVFAFHYYGSTIPPILSNGAISSHLKSEKKPKVKQDVWWWKPRSCPLIATHMWGEGVLNVLNIYFDEVLLVNNFLYGDYLHLIYPNELVVIRIQSFLHSFIT